MAIPYAEVIGNPIAQSKSPLIHKHWLAELGLEGDYRAAHVRPAELPGYIAARRQDRDWRGCNVTIPHKETVIPLLDRIDPGAEAIGAVNCVAPGPEGLTGRNTDIDGVAAALDPVPLEGAKAVVVGAGGGARAALQYLAGRGARVTILVRNPAKAAHFGHQVLPLEQCEEALEGAAAIVNASPLGMEGCPEMPLRLLDAAAAAARGATLFDMVYKPLGTPFLAAGRANGGVAVDGLTMLIGQARPAFKTFFGREPPADEARLRDMLST